MYKSKNFKLLTYDVSQHCPQQVYCTFVWNFYFTLTKCNYEN